MSRTCRAGEAWSYDCRRYCLRYRLQTWETSLPLMLKDIILGATVWDDVSIEFTTVTGGHCPWAYAALIYYEHTFAAACAQVMPIATSESSRILLQGPAYFWVRPFRLSYLGGIALSVVPRVPCVCVSHLFGHVHEGVAQYGWQHLGKPDTIKFGETTLDCGLWNTSW